MEERCSRGFLRRLATLTLMVMLVAAGALSFASVPVEAKAVPKLSAKSVTIAKGGKQTIKLKNGKGSWTIKGNGVAKIKSKTKTSVTITPVKAGNTVVTCKVGGKKLTCKVNVLNDRIGDVSNLGNFVMLAGETCKKNYTIPLNVSVQGLAFKDEGLASATINSNDGGNKIRVSLEIKAKKPGKTILRIFYLEDEKMVYEDVVIIIINNFRGKDKIKKTDSNYKAWRKKTISTMVSADMTTWEIIDAIGYLISTGKYSNKGGANGIQLWYGGNGTCWSGAMMMDDFMKDLGIKSKVKFVGGKQAPAKDIYGYTTAFLAQHKDTWVTLGGKTYELQPQPEAPWPLGTVKR